MQNESNAIKSLIPGWNTENRGRRRNMNGENCEDSSGLHVVLLARVAVEEDFSFSFGANISLFFLLWFKVSELKQVKQGSLRQGLVSSGDTCRETARNNSFWFLFLCSYSLPSEYLLHRPTVSCCSLLFLYLLVNLNGYNLQQPYCILLSSIIILGERIVIA